ncbi:MAG: hypothetical protein AB4041_06515 [Microcystaceae cyanobacterium]
MKPLIISFSIYLIGMPVGVALPPPDDLPEEVLRTEIILEGRSPINGEPVTAAEYEQQTAELAESPYPPQVNSELQQLIFLLRIRKMIKTFTPL